MQYMYVILFVSRQSQDINKTRMQGERFLKDIHA